MQNNNNNNKKAEGNVTWSQAHKRDKVKFFTYKPESDERKPDEKKDLCLCA